MKAVKKEKPCDCIIGLDLNRYGEWEVYTKSSILKYPDIKPDKYLNYCCNCGKHLKGVR